MKDFKKWREWYIKWHIYLWDKPKWIIYQLYRYYIFNKFRDFILKHPKIFRKYLFNKYI
jgi:hypothetical protein